MKIAGKKVITLSDNEKSVLKGAAYILEILSDQIDYLDDDFTMELNRAYDTCMSAAKCGSFEYEIDDGNE